MAENRRSFLRQLAGLPLIGGSVALVGQPSAVAEPVTADMMEAYKTWLHYEMRFLCFEMSADPVCIQRYPWPDRLKRADMIEAMFHHDGVGNAARFHGGKNDTGAIFRAPLVLAAVGRDWRAG